jgi:hypothetical protein
MEIPVYKSKRKRDAYLTEQIHSRVSKGAKHYLDDLCDQSGYKPSTVIDAILLYCKNKDIKFINND